MSTVRSWQFLFVGAPKHESVIAKGLTFLRACPFHGLHLVFEIGLRNGLASHLKEKDI